MKHSKKIILARKMRTPAEEARGVMLFDSKEWNKRKDSRALKVASKMK